VLKGQSCSARDWGTVWVEEGFNPVRVRNTHFAGTVKLGALRGTVSSAAGVEKISGIFNAYLENCTVGRDVRIANVGVHIGNYEIGDGVCIEDVGILETAAGSTFGNGVEVEVLNEGGGREVILFDELSAQFAYLLCLHRYRPKLVEGLQAIARGYVETVRGDIGRIGAGVRIQSTKEIRNVHIGAGAVIAGAGSLVNGTILSTAAAVTRVGQDVAARDFIIAEGAQVTEGAIVEKCYVGQGCQIGKQFSATHCLFFANCEAFHGEACSVFAGPYTVTHHKSTLLIAGLFSFYNAGSGTNQSNHMYKLGPVHEGRLERGTKTGSFSYLMWPCRVGAFGVVLGKHTNSFDTTDFPFSHHEADSNGRCVMVPGLNLITVGSVRDGAKWPRRDGRQAGHRRDHLSFEVFTPYTVGKMRRGLRRLKELRETTDKSVDQVMVNGAFIKRPLLRMGGKFYRIGIEHYLLEKLFSRLEGAVQGGREAVRALFGEEGKGLYSKRWVDLGGQLMACERMSALEATIESGEIGSLEQFRGALDTIQAGTDEDEWAWVKAVSQEVFEKDWHRIEEGDLTWIATYYLKVRQKFLQMVRTDAEKEFGETSRLGFGQDGPAEANDQDFAAVRGHSQSNSFIREMEDCLAALKPRVSVFLDNVNRFL